MCGRYAIDLNPDYIAEYYDVAIPADFTARYNVAPSQMIPVVCQDDSGRVVDFMRWGLIPPWSKNHEKYMINARSETVTSKPSFKQAFRHRRCIIPASGFYEWRKSGNHKIPYYICLVDNSPMSFAGIWEKWRSPEKVVVETCAILTTVANATIGPIHNRMPVILSQENLSVWLDGNAADSEKLLALLSPYSAEKIFAYPVSTMVNNPKNDIFSEICVSIVCFLSMS